MEEGERAGELGVSLRSSHEKCTRPDALQKLRKSVQRGPLIDYIVFLMKCATWCTKTSLSLSPVILTS